MVAKYINEFQIEGCVYWKNYKLCRNELPRTTIGIKHYDSERDRIRHFLITFFNNIAISVDKNLAKGNSVWIKGYLNNNIYENKKGDLISETQLIGNQYELIDDIELPVYKSVEDGIEQLEDED